MAEQQHATPIWIGVDENTAVLERIPVSGGDSTYNEEFIQKLAFKHPSCLPVNEIDRAYEGLIPVCMELNTQAGPLDILYVTPKGKLVVVEAKLWRNPEARRKVIGQILDYAKELARWDYEDLQREVSRATGRKGNVLYDIVSEHHPDTNESEFVDEVTRSLTKGRVLLMILGDGIREGVGAIAEYLEDVGNLEFTFGLVELAIYRTPDNGMLLQPRVLAKTVVFKRTVVSLKDGKLEIEDDLEEQEEIHEVTETQQFYLDFWPELLSELKLDDISQPMPATLGKRGSIFFAMPPSGQEAWLTVYFSGQRNEAGVFLTFTRGALADSLYEKLVINQDEINKELGLDGVSWSSDDGKYMISAHCQFRDIRAMENRESIKEFLKDTLNHFVNVFRPRLERIVEEE